MCTSFKEESWQDLHHLGDASASPIGGDTINLALITLASPEGTYGAASTNYSDITGNSEEATDSASPQGYTAGGGTLTNNGVTTSGTTAYADFADITFTAVNLTAHGCMLYNSTNGNRAISTHDFGGAQTASGGNFVIQFPTADASNAILRLA
jgi:hypothetical protein